MPDASSFFFAIPHLEIHAEHIPFDALLPHSKSMWTSHKGTSARKRFSTTLVQVEILSNYASTHTRSVKVKKASFQPCSLFRGQSSELRKSCLLFIGKIFVCWYQPRKKISSLRAPLFECKDRSGNRISVSSSDNVLQAAKAAALFPSSFATGDVLLNLD